MLDYNLGYIDTQKLFSSELGRELYSVFSRTVSDYEMSDFLDKGVVVGFSGGADSVALLLLLLEFKRRNSLKFGIYPIHINHMIRGDEAVEDQQFSHVFCKSAGLELVCRCIDIPKISKELSLGMEECARNERYRVFAEHMENTYSSCIAVAHNADDNAETLLFNLTRGSGTRGGCGIRPIRELVVRPIIRLRKCDIVSFLNANSIPFRVDSTNLSVEYTRNYLRLEVLPMLERINEGYAQAFLRFTESAYEDTSFLDRMAYDAYEKIALRFSDDSFDKSLLADLPSPILTRVIFIVLHRMYGISPEYIHINSIKECLRDEVGAVSLPGNLIFHTYKGKCYFLKNSKEKLSYYKKLHSGVNYINELDAAIVVGQATDETSLNVYKFSIHTCISSAIISNGLYIRSRTDGDKYKYFGITHKLKKVYNDRNVSPMLRDFIPVVCDEQGIVWVPGLSVRDGFFDKGDDGVKISFYCNKGYMIAK